MFIANGKEKALFIETVPGSLAKSGGRILSLGNWYSTRVFWSGTRKGLGGVCNRRPSRAADDVAHPEPAGFSRRVRNGVNHGGPLCHSPNS